MRWKCTCSYDGTRYFGWQIQNGDVTVQQTINEALGDILKEAIIVTGSGRTDTGVHALGQVFHFDFDWKHGADRLKKALNSKLPHDIRVNAVDQVEDVFHSRFSAVSKRYHYRLFLGMADPFEWNYCWSLPDIPDLNAIRESMGYLLGEHDFAAFAANRGKEYESTVRNLTRADIRLESGIAYLTFEANGFMYKMVRSMVGALANVGMRRLKPVQIKKFLNTAKRTPLIVAAPSRGLFLEKVFY